MKTKFIIISSMRCGTNYLRTLLNSHPKIECEGELLNETLFNKIKLKELEENIWSRKKPVVGFKVFYSHAKQYPKVWEYIINKKLRVIHLKRKNQLDRFLSIMLAKKHGLWHSEDARDTYTKPITIDVKKFATETRKITRMEKIIHKMYIKTNPMLEIYYEDLDFKLKNIQEFLGVEVLKLSSKSVKLTTKRKEDLILNYKEITTAFPQYA